MANVSEYLRLHKNEIVDLVEAKHAPEAIRGETFEALVNHLMISLPLGRDGQIWRLIEFDFYLKGMQNMRIAIFYQRLEFVHKFGFLHLSA